VSPHPTLEGPWERFRIASWPNSSRVGLRADNGLYVSGNLGSGRRLVADRAAWGPWETFEFVPR
jgi:hypothetical protein